MRKRTQAVHGTTTEITAYACYNGKERTDDGNIKIMVMLKTDMSETVKKRIAIREIRNPYFCVWLQEMAEQGLFLKKLGILNAEFTKDEPEKRRYRILQKRFDSLSEDEKAAIVQRGWKPVRAGHATILYTTDMEAPEPVDDIRNYYFSSRFEWIWSVLWILIICYWIYRAASGEPGLSDKAYIEEFGRLHAAEANGVIITAAAALTGIVIAAIGIRVIWREITNLKHYRNKEMPDYDIPYDDRRYLHAKTGSRIQRILLIAFFAGIAAMWIGLLISGKNVHDGPAAISYKYDHPVQLEEIDPDMWSRALPLIEDSSNGNTLYCVDYTIGKDDPGFYVREGYWQGMNLDRITDEESDDIVTEGRYYAEYLILRNEADAEEYLGEEIAYDMYEKVENGSAEKALEKVKFDNSGLDYAGYYSEKDPLSTDGYDSQHLYLRKGRIIYTVNYTGSADLKDKLGIYADDMSA